MLWKATSSVTVGEQFSATRTLLVTAGADLFTSAWVYRRTFQCSGSLCFLQRSSGLRIFAETEQRATCFRRARSGCETAMCPRTREGWWHARLHQLECNCPAEGFGSFCLFPSRECLKLCCPALGSLGHGGCVCQDCEPTGRQWKWMGSLALEEKLRATLVQNLWGLETLMLFHHLNGSLQRGQRQTICKALCWLVENQWAQVPAQEVPIS